MRLIPDGLNISVSCSVSDTASSGLSDRNVLIEVTTASVISSLSSAVDMAFAMCMSSALCSTEFSVLKST